MNDLTAAYGPIRYAIPREGEHGTVNCWFGKHWWTLVRRERDGLPLTVACAVCRKVLPVRDIGPDFGKPSAKQVNQKETNA